MQEAIQQQAELDVATLTSGKGRNFNVNKLQAVFCMVTSALISIIFIAWGARTFF